MASRLIILGRIYTFKISGIEKGGSSEPSKPPLPTPLCMQHFAEQLYSTQFVPLERCRHAAAVGLLCKLLDEMCREHLQRFCPLFHFCAMKTSAFQHFTTIFIG